MTAPTSLIGMVDDSQYGTIVADVYEHIPALYYPSSVPVFAEMRRDARLAAIVDGYGLQLRRAQWQLDGTGCRPEVVRFVADCLGINVVGEDHAGGARRRGVSWNDHLRSALLCEVFGHYAFEMQAEIDQDGRARLATLAERIPATITNIHADPKTGALLGIDQQITTSRRTGPQIPADRLVFYSRNREGASWQGTSLLRPAYAPWLLKREMLRVAAISNRRWGAGVPVAEALPGTNPSPGQMAEAQRLASAARAGDQAGASVPPGFTMKIVGLSGSIPDTVGFIRFLNQEIAGSVLMPHLDLGTTATGSRALGESFVDSWLLALESEAEAIADTATRQAVVPIVDWNWGEDEPAPRIVVSGVGSRREITAESLKLLLDGGALAVDPRLEAWVRREFRLPERDPDAPKPLPAGPPARVPEQPEVVSADDVAEVAASVDDGGDGEGEVRAAPAPAGVDYQALDADHAAAVEDITAGWEDYAGPLVTALAAAVAVEATGGALSGLAGLAVPPAATAELLRVMTEGLLTLARRSARRAAVEAAEFGRVQATLTQATRDRIADLAQATTNLIVAGYQSAATRLVLGLTGPDTSVEQVRETVRSALADLSQAKSTGLVAGNVSAAAGTAQGYAREQVFAGLPAGTRFRASEVNDNTACGPCRRVDGREYDSLGAALADYPAGRYRACDGRDRCRGFIYPVAFTDNDQGAAGLNGGEEQVEARRGFDPNQKRDRIGRWTRTGGGTSSTGGGDRKGRDRSSTPMTDAEFEARQEMVAKVIGDARKTHATEITHTTADGAWKPERDKLHREIATELYAKADNVPRDGKAVIAGGLGGAGKSTVLRDHAGIDQSQYVTLNPDDVKELMAERGLIPEVPGHPDLSPMERAALVHEESSRITKLLADMAYRDRRNVIWDITMSSEGGAVSRLTDLDRFGYETRGVFVDIPVEVSVSRALSRYRRGADGYRAGKGYGGRFVPPAIIRAQQTSGGATVNREVFDRIADRFTDWSVYDNSVTGRAPEMVAHSGVTGQ